MFMYFNIEQVTSVKIKVHISNYPNEANIFGKMNLKLDNLKC